ncbi:MAG: site-specific DNA-methyltransferase [Pseudomonadota bacterium]
MTLHVLDFKDGANTDDRPLARIVRGDSYDVLATTLDAYRYTDDRVACVMDPPYLIEISGGGKYKAKRSYYDKIEEKDLHKGFDIRILDVELQDDCWCTSAVVFCSDRQLAEILPALSDRYDKLALLAWRKTNPQPLANKSYMAELELYIHAWNKGAHPVGDLPLKKRIWDGPVGKSIYDHPTVKPLALMDKIIANTNADLIVDPFMGTGTTGVAALRAGKRFLGIEKDPDYFEIARARLRETLLQPGFDFGGDRAA